MLPLLVFVALVAVALAYAWWRERVQRQRREQERVDYSATVLSERTEALAQARAQEQALFDSMAEGVLVLGPAGRIELANRALEHLFSLKGSVHGQTLSEAFRLLPLTELGALVDRERSVREHELVIPGTSERLVEVNAAVMSDSSGARQGTIFVFHDLTRLRQLENIRREFVANVSHELRTPLSMIKGFAETLLDGGVADPAQADRFLRKIDHHADRLTYLIEDLLTISQLEAGQVALRLQPVPLRELAARVAIELQSRAAAREIVMKNLVPENAVALADPDRLHQVVFNLVENAIKYGRQSGRVTFDATPADGGWQFSVRDDGIGIPAEAKDRVFERFFRVDKARARETGGTGLGLAIVKHIVQAHGGRVWVESEEGRGSTFFLSLRTPEARANSCPPLAGEVETADDTTLTP